MEDPNQPDLQLLPLQGLPEPSDHEFFSALGFQKLDKPKSKPKPKENPNA